MIKIELSDMEQTYIIDSLRSIATDDATRARDRELPLRLRDQFARQAIEKRALADKIESAT